MSKPPYCESHLSEAVYAILCEAHEEVVNCFRDNIHCIFNVILTVFDKRCHGEVQWVD
jgi:hypothetical protein